MAHDLPEYLREKLSALHPNARLVFVFDSAGRLALDEELSVAGRTWAVYHYNGNDLALRAALDTRSSQRWLIWVTLPPMAAGCLDLSSLADLLSQADDYFDITLTGFLREHLPAEHWPAEALAEHEDILSADLPALLAAHGELRHYLDPGAALDVHAVRALALHLRQPNIPVSEFLFHRDAPGKALQRYIRLAWGADWDESALECLRQQAQSSPAAQADDIAAWFDVPTRALGAYLYWRRFLGQHSVSNIANQLRGTGILAFDPEPLEPWVEEVLRRWQQDEQWRTAVIMAAEASLREEELRRTVALLPTLDGPAILQALRQAEAPAIVAELAARFLATLSQHDLSSLASWLAHRPASFAALPETPYSAAARSAIGLLDELAAIVNCLLRKEKPPAELEALLDWYVDGRYYDLEYAYSQAVGHLRSLADRAVAQNLQSYLADLRRRMRALLQQADTALGQCLQSHWKDYLAHPRLATQLIRQLLRQSQFKFRQGASLWIVVFDDMRYDGWQRLVKPRLLQDFQSVVSEHSYLCLAPSYTLVARRALLAGQLPDKWRNPGGGFTTNEASLVAKLLNVRAEESASRLRFFSRSESDRSYNQLDENERYPINVLVFNISDDNLHMEGGGLESLNSKVAALLDDILKTLKLHVRPQDLLLLASDHGFIELEADDAQEVQSGGLGATTLIESNIHPRYLAAVERPNAGVVLRMAPLVESPFTVAVGKRWFRRAGDNHPPPRYAHGGISLAEMVVPGIALRRIAERRIEMVVSAPTSLVAQEGEALAYEVTVANRGNQAERYLLSVKANTDVQAQQLSGSLEPGERRAVSLTLQPVYRERGESTTYIALELSYEDASGRQQRRRQDLPVQVSPRRDAVEISYGGLDELDSLT